MEWKIRGWIEELHYRVHTVQSATPSAEHMAMREPRTYTPIRGCMERSSSFGACLLTIYIVIPNTAVFGPTKLIGTIASTTTARMKISDDEDF